MRSVNVHEAKTNFSALLAEIEQHGERIVICRNGQPVADLVPHRRKVSMAPDPKLGAFTIGYDPIEELTDEEWPRDGQ
jgi:antitoxin (DNA-binding transcriptional repressor) of toxin-antitoxin stability system